MVLWLSRKPNCCGIKHGFFRLSERYIDECDTPQMDIDFLDYNVVDKVEMNPARTFSLNETYLYRIGCLLERYIANSSVT